MKRRFKLVSDYKPTGDQPQAIETIVEALKRGDKFVTLLGATGTGKTFTISNVIERLQRPTLVMAPNKTLAAQLYQEFREFFPENAVEYFISYYDYYQPEAYLPDKGQYIEKDLSINEQIQRYRLSTIKSLLTREDVIVVASVSCIYALENPAVRRKRFLHIEVGDNITIKELSKKLVALQYERNDFEVKPGLFRVKGDTVILYPAEYIDIAYRIMFFGDEIESIYIIDPVSNSVKKTVDGLTLFPAVEFGSTDRSLESIIAEIRRDLKIESEELRRRGKIVEAERLIQRVNYDIEMILETGHVKGIENYSRYFDGRKPGEPPYTLLDYFPPNYLIVMDESHLGIPQIRGMIAGDISRKKNLVEYGFRLKAAFDNRPLTFEEWESKINQIIFTSATPGDYELSKSKVVADQVIRPTGLVDPYVEVRGTENQIDDLLTEIRKVIARDERVLITTLTKRLAESIADYYAERGIKITYLHSDIDAIERSEILRRLRSGELDAVIGINLLREGLDLPEVSLVAILDADREGFLRDTRSLIQTIGRASRNVNGHVIMYADRITRSMAEAIKETERRRKKQMEYNKKHGITPRTIKKAIASSMNFDIAEEEEKEESFRRNIAEKVEEYADMRSKIEFLTDLMYKAAENLEFEKAAYLRDLINELKGKEKANTVSRRGKKGGRK